MGRDQVRKKIKISAIQHLILGIAIGLFGGFFVVCVFFSGWPEELSECIMAVVFGAVAVWGIVMIVSSIRTLINPENSSTMKKNPGILQQADELFRNIIYQDEMIILSPRIIANAKDVREIAYTDEVFLIYVYKHKTNGITNQKELVLQTARGTIEINIFWKNDAKVDELANRILQNCRYARAGYTPDGLRYVEEMRELWKRDQESKGVRV